MRNRLIVRAALGIVLLAIAFALTPGAQSDGDYITGVVTLRTGARTVRPLPSAWVIVSQDGNEKGRSLTGDDGAYYIGNLSAGTYKLMVYEKNRQLSDEQVNLPGDSSHDISVK
ncbi:MAG TPA: carboxypeptidase-like regulatory domain-containing protein [Pyrinomonadaceae bacterium]|jgi:hypothetical protein|nr:carboxypeptidase-like regulatory domain-containing protein [Pyrinomonadaceae bacterium]